MNETLMKYLEGAEGKYPHRLEANYPRILEKIAELWSSPHQIADYFTDLMIDKRGTRQGFPPDIASEIFVLSIYYDNFLAKQAESGDAWGNEKEGAGSPVEQLKKIGLNFTPAHMMKAAEFSDPSRVLLFLQAGMDVDVRDERDWTPLMVAAFNGNEAVAKLLIEHGANPSAQDRAGYTPLHWSALNGYLEVVRMLIAKRIDLNAQSNYGLTAILQAASKGHADVIALLIEAHADPKIANNEGFTPLHKAVANDHVDSVAILVHAGASIVAASNQGATPLSIAQGRKHGEILEILRHGLKLSAGAGLASTGSAGA
jgi:ankyrin repeat protein